MSPGTAPAAGSDVGDLAAERAILADTTIRPPVNEHLPSRVFDRVDEELELMTQPISVIRP